MVDNSDFFENNIPYNDREYCYFINLQTRNKDGFISNFNQSFYPIKNKRQFRTIFKIYKDISDSTGFRIYFILNPVYYSSFVDLLKERLKTLNDEEIFNLYGNSNCSSVENNLYYLIDIDKEELFLMDEIKEYVKNNCKNTHIIPTLDGFHIFGYTNEILKILTEFPPLASKFHTDCRALLYSPK